REVEHALHRLCWDARAVVRHCDAGLVDYDGDLGGDASLLAGVERVADQLLEHDDRPGLDGLPGLDGQLLADAEFEETAGPERLAAQPLRGFANGCMRVIGRCHPTNILMFEPAPSSRRAAPALPVQSSRSSAVYRGARAASRLG